MWVCVCVCHCVRVCVWAVALLPAVPLPVRLLAFPRALASDACSLLLLLLHLYVH